MYTRRSRKAIRRSISSRTEPEPRASWASFFRRRLPLLQALVLGLAVTCAGARVHADTDLGSPTADVGAILGASARTHGAEQALRSLYPAGSTAGPLLWMVNGEATVQARALLDVLRDAERYGLDPRDYRAPPLATLPARTAPDNAARSAWDASLSAATLRFVSDLHYGRIAAEAAGFKLRESRAPLDLVSTLRAIAGAADVPAAVGTVEPQFFHYGLLKEALARLRTLERQHEFTQLPPPKDRLKLGETYAGAPALRAGLFILGDLTAADAPAAGDQAFDASLSEGVRRYQLRHGLAPSGLLDARTMKALRTPPARRIRQIELTLERWRWLSPFKTPPIIVNIPQFRLFAFRSTADRAADILQMDVIVGRTFPQTQTPVFEGDMRYVILRPYWDVPYSIAKNELLKKIIVNPGYLDAQHLEIAAAGDDAAAAVPATSENIHAVATGKLRLRQRPGEDNALGLAKFMFPNPYNVYLHSTPAHALFEESVRAFSHGCIRVSDPAALAAFVLKDAPGDWSLERVRTTMDGDATVRVNLKQPINVLILYATALATEAGTILFFDDIYGYDQKLERQLGLQPVG